MKKEQIKAALAYSGISQNKLVKNLGYSQANLNKKISRETLTDEELKKIAEAMGAVYQCYFEFKDGTKI